VVLVTVVESPVLDKRYCPVAGVTVPSPLDTAHPPTADTCPALSSRLVQSPTSTRSKRTTSSIG
jgi:hypothetical protein